MQRINTDELPAASKSVPVEYRQQILSYTLKDEDHARVTDDQSPAHAQQSTCAGCRRAITDRYLLKIVRRLRTTDTDEEGHGRCAAQGDTTSDLIWHEGCLKCSCCACILIRVSATLYVRGDLTLCRQDYLRLYGKTSECQGCSNVITPFEMVMKVRQRFYHNDCFVCHQCKERFRAGSHCYIHNDQILCETDWTELKQRTSGCSTARVPGAEHLHMHLDRSQMDCCVTGRYLTMPSEVDLPVAEVPDGGDSVDDDASSGYGSPSPPNASNR